MIPLASIVIILALNTYILVYFFLITIDRRRY